MKTLVFNEFIFLNENYMENFENLSMKIHGKSNGICENININ
jgi:hypothetical protein